MQPPSDPLPSAPRAADADAAAAAASADVPSATSPELIIAPPSPPCSPRSMSLGLAGLHRAPGRHYPQPRCAMPSAIVPRSRFRLAHPKQPPKQPMPLQDAPLPKNREPSSNVSASEWMILKLDEDLSDPDDDGYVSDGAAESDDAYGGHEFELDSRRHDSRRHGAFEGAASLPVPVPMSLPARSVAPPPYFRRHLRVPLTRHYASAATPNTASRSYPRYIFDSSDSGSDIDH